MANPIPSRNADSVVSGVQKSPWASNQMTPSLGTADTADASHRGIAIAAENQGQAAQIAGLGNTPGDLPLRFED